MRRTLIAILFLAVAATLFPGPAKAQAAHSNTLTWGASSSTGATYNVYKQPACAGAFTKLNTAPITLLTFIDSGMADGEVNCYLVTAQVAGSAESPQAQSTVTRATTPSSTPGLLVTAPPSAPKVSGQ